MPRAEPSDLVSFVVLLVDGPHQPTVDDGPSGRNMEQLSRSKWSGVCFFFSFSFQSTASGQNETKREPLVGAASCCYWIGFAFIIDRFAGCCWFLFLFLHAGSDETRSAHGSILHFMAVRGRVSSYGTRGRTKVGQTQQLDTTESPGN